MTDDLSLKKQADTRMLGIVTSLGGAACLAFAVCSGNWLVNPGLGIAFGLRKVSGAMGIQLEDGASMSNGDFVAMVRGMGGADDQVSGAWAPMGWVTTIALVLSALGLAAAAGLALAKKKPTLPMSPSTGALLGIMTSLITGCVFVATKPGQAGLVGVGMAFWIFGVGAVAGIAGAQMLAKVNRPLDPDLMSDAMNPEQF